MPASLHDDEIPIDMALVRALVDRALPMYTAHELRPLGGSGSTNALFRLGNEFIVRIPRQRGGSTVVDKEFRWLAMIEPRLSVAVPHVVAVCEPDLGYPERWSVTTWIAGDAPTVAPDEVHPAVARHPLAQDLADTITQLQNVEVPAEALRDVSLRSYRGRPLTEREADFREDIEACRRLRGLDLDLDAALEVMADAIATTTSGDLVVESTRWYHGDLLAENLLVRDGRLAAILDFGGLAIGDPTVDLTVAWEVLDVASRDAFRRALALDDARWLRSMAWALSIAAMTFPYYWHTMPTRCAHRLAMARAVLQEARASS